MLFKNDFKLLTAFLFVSVFAINFCSGQCTRHQKDRGDHLADKFGKTYVSEAWGGGDNISVSVSDCHYNTYSKELILDVSVTFNGIFFSSNYYVINGEFKISDNDQLREFEIKYLNDRAKSTLRNYKMLFGAAVIYNLD